MRTGSLHLAPHFAVIAAVVAAVTLVATETMDTFGYGCAAGYVVLAAVVGHFARAGHVGWPLQLGACNWLLLFADHQRPLAAGDVPLTLGELTFDAIIMTLVCVILFGTVVVSARDIHAARDRSIASAAERRFVVAAGLLPADYALVFFARALDDPFQRYLCLALFVAIKVLFLGANELTVRKLRAAGATTPTLIDAQLRPGPEVPQVDLGAGTELRIEVTAAAGYRDAPEAVRAVVGSMEQSVALVRGRSLLYLKIVVGMWLIPVAFVLLERFSPHSQ
ncbi:MAG: hypothetical protein ABI321_13200 [Polyangia bacterium]